MAYTKNKNPSYSRGLTSNDFTFVSPYSRARKSLTAVSEQKICSKTGNSAKNPRLVSQKTVKNPQKGQIFTQSSKNSPKTRKTSAKNSKKLPVSIAKETVIIFPIHKIRKHPKKIKVDYVGVPAGQVHVSVQKVITSRRAAAETSSRRSYRFARKSVLTVITSLMLVMVIFTFFNFVVTPEFTTKHTIEDIVKDYYENYFYLSIMDSNSISLNEDGSSVGREEALNRIFSKYANRGFATVSLKQLLLYDDARHASAASTLSEYCDLGATRITIYPEAPFYRTDYRVDYSYSCKF